MTTVLRAFVLMLGLAGLLSACDNTIRGIGQDLNESGDAIEDQT